MGGVDGGGERGNGGVAGEFDSVGEVDGGVTGGSSGVAGVSGGVLDGVHGVPDGVPGVPDGVPGVPGGVPGVPGGVPGVPDGVPSGLAVAPDNAVDLSVCRGSVHDRMPTSLRISPSSLRPCHPQLPPHNIYNPYPYHHTYNH